MNRALFPKDMNDGVCRVWLLDGGAAGLLCRTLGCGGTGGTPQHDRGQCPCVRRLVLSWHLGVPPESLEFRRTAGKVRDGGRPCLVGGGLDFNVSHSGGVLAIAVVLLGRVGVDVQTELAEETCRDVAAQVLTPRERRAIRNLQGNALGTAGEFTRLWCRKEAAGKHSGHGLAFPFDGLDVMEDEVDAVSGFDGYRLAVRLLDFVVPGTARGAVAVGDGIRRVELIDCRAGPDRSAKAGWLRSARVGPPDMAALHQSTLAVNPELL